MGKLCDIEEAAALTRRGEKQDAAFHFLGLSPEIRSLVYQYHFSTAIIAIEMYCDEEGRAPKAMRQDYIRHRARRYLPGDAFDMTPSLSSFHQQYDPNMDSWDRVLTRTVNPISAAEIEDSIKEEWRRDFGIDRCSTRVYAGSAARLGDLLLTCQIIRREAQPFLASAVHPVILNSESELWDLPKACQQVYLPRIRSLTLSSEHGLRRHGHRFDVRQLPSLETLKIVEPFEDRNKYVFVADDPDRMVDFVHGGKDELFIQDWYRKELDFTNWETAFVEDQEDPHVRQRIMQKNTACYWLRELMLDSSLRTFRILIRRRLSLLLHLLARNRDRDQDGQASDDGQDVKHECRVHLVGRASHASSRQANFGKELDFDIDTRLVIDRHVERPNTLPLSEKADLKRWVINETPLRVMEDDRDLVDGPPDDEYVQDILLAAGKTW